MSPQQIHILLHYYYSPVDYQAAFTQSVRCVINTLADDELLQRNAPSDTFTAIYGLTERGRAYVEALLNMPLPIQKIEWVIPSRKEVLS